jgi:hypothetical protein
MRTVHEIRVCRKPEASNDFSQRLSEMLGELEQQWRLEQGRPGRIIDTPRQSLLRVAHFALAGVLELDEAGRLR